MWRKEDVIEKLKEDQGERSLRAYATAIGCSPAYLSDIYNNRRDPGKMVLDHLNITATKVTTVTYTERKWRKQ